MTRPRLVPAPKINNPSDDELLRRAQEFYEVMRRRRTIRDFSDRSVSREVIRVLYPHGRNGSERSELAAVAFRSGEQCCGEARNSHRGGSGGERILPTSRTESLAGSARADRNRFAKPFLEIAPWLIAVFAQPFRTLADGKRSPATYYAIESVGIATGILVTAVHSCGLAALTHTPSPMGFLNRILGRPWNEKPFVLPCGWSSRGKRACSRY